MEFTQEHEGIRRNVKRLIDTEINPHVDAWEEAGIFPAHDVFKKLGELGYLGINKPAKYGGMGLDYSYQMVFLETLGHIRCGGVQMAIGVQTDMATPALARFGSEELCKEFLVPSIAGDYVACLGVSEVGARVQRRLDQDHSEERRRRLRHQRRQDVDHQWHPGQLDVPARQHVGWPRAQEQVADLPADADQGRRDRAQARQDGYALLRHRADLLHGRARAAALSDRQGGRRLHLPDAANSRRSACMPPPPASSPRSA